MLRRIMELVREQQDVEVTFRSFTKGNLPANNGLEVTVTLLSEKEPRVSFAQHRWPYYAIAKMEAPEDLVMDRVLILIEQARRNA